jgi:hypothetical protein
LAAFSLQGSPDDAVRTHIIFDKNTTIWPGWIDYCGMPAWNGTLAIGTVSSVSRFSKDLILYQIDEASFRAPNHKTS